MNSSSGDLSNRKETDYFSLNILIFTTYSLISVGYFIVIYIAQYHYPVVFVALITENYWGETATFFAYLVTAFLLGRLALQGPPQFRRVVWAVTAIAAAFIAFEEISWGMLIHKLEPPEWLMRINAQGELNLHNIGEFNRYRSHLEKLAGWLLIAWSLISIVVLRAMKRFDFNPLAVGVPIFPLRLLPCVLVVAVLFIVRPFIKSDELGELALAILVLMWAADLHAHLGNRSAGRLATFLRMRRSAFVAVVALTTLWSLTIMVFYPGVLNWRMNITAARDYPSRGMLEQSRELFEYIFDHPRHLNDETRSNYRRLFGDDADTDDQPQ